MADTDKALPTMAPGKGDPAAEKAFGKQAEASMQAMMMRMSKEYPEVMKSVMVAIQDNAKAGHKGPPSSGIMKILRTELPASEWEPMLEKMEASLPPAPKVGTTAPDFNLPVMGTEDYVRLSDHKGKHAVALIFGNYT